MMVGIVPQKSECQNGVVREEGKPVQVEVQHICDRTAEPM